MAKSPAQQFIDTQKTSLVKLDAEATALQHSQTIKTEEGRALINFHRRVLEVLLYGETKTPPLIRHHE